MHAHNPSVRDEETGELEVIHAGSQLMYQRGRGYIKTFLKTRNLSVNQKWVAGWLGLPRVHSCPRHCLPLSFHCWL